MPADVSLAARPLFPGAAQSAYLDVASRGLVPESALAIAHEHMHDRMLGRADKAGYFAAMESARSRFARLVGAAAHEVAVMKNISEGLNAIAASLPWRAGDEILVCADLEHPANLYPWRNLERRGARLVDLPQDDGAVPVEAMIARLSPRVRVAAVSATTFRPGLRSDLARLGAACRANGTLLVVDAAQSAGITHTDVAAQQIDVLAASCQKGLCSLYGMGFLYVREAVAQDIEPAYLARFGVEIEQTHEADYDRGPLRYKRGALRLDVGNYNFLAAQVTDHTLGLLLDIGTQAIDAHVTALARSLAQALQARGIRTAVPPDHPLHANMVCVDAAQAGLATPPAEAYRALNEAGVHAALRGRYLRFSFHLYNDAGDVQAATEAMSAMAP